MKNVLFLQAVVKQYRVPFLEMAHSALEEEGIKLTVAYGLPSQIAKRRVDNAELSKEIGVKINNYWFFRNRILYQSALQQILRADLVIVEQANRHIINYLLLILSAVAFKKVAFWGHGRNRQAKENTISEWWKEKFLNKTDWWFAYTEGTAEYLISKSVSRKKITVIQNSIDTRSFKDDLARISESDLEQIKHELTITPGTMLGLFCGSLYSHKSLEFLIKAAEVVKSEIRDFKLIIIGDGPDKDLIINAASKKSWIHYVGAKFGMEKALYFKVADVFLMPGLVGLAILDAFTAGLPLVTTNISTHSPEIEYLIDGVNGMVTPHNSLSYANSVIRLLNDQAILGNLREGAALTAETYSIDMMVEKFKLGVIQCLKS